MASTKNKKKPPRTTKPHRAPKNKQSKGAAVTSKTLRVRFRGMAYGKSKLSLGMSVPLDGSFSQEDLAALLIGGRLSFRISDPKDIPGQQVLPGVGNDSDYEPIEFEAETGNMTVSRDGSACSLHINHEDLDLEEFKHYCFHEARAEITRLGNKERKTKKPDVPGQAEMGGDNVDEDADDTTETETEAA